MEHTDSNGSLKRTNPNESPDSPLHRPKRPKSSKACNACRRQKSRCEKLAGDLDSCHRCSVIGIACVFDAGPVVDNLKARKPRPLLPATTRADVGPSALRSTPQISSRSPDTARLHALADTTEMLSRPAPKPVATSGRHPVARRRNSFPSGTPSTPSLTPTSKSTLSPETLSTVESTLFPSPRDPTTEAQSARVRADWRRWVAPLTLLQSLVRRNRPTMRSVGPDLHQLTHPTEKGAITPAQERRLKEHFRQRYLPWLPAVRFVRDNASDCLDNVSPFLATVICATAARTTPDVSLTTIEHLRTLALHHVGQVFSNPSAQRLVDSLYALLILVLWPLDAADDVVLLINGARQLANAYERTRGEFSGGSSSKPDDLDVDNARLWYTICASETILNLGSGSPASPPALEDLIGRLGSASDLALESGCTSDILLILQTGLHRIVAAAMPDKEHGGFKGGPSLLNGREPLLHYISTVHMFLTRLGEWDIEFHSISAECEGGGEAVYYAALEIEYHYLRLMLVTHCLLTLCHVCPLHSASDEVKFALWSWSITGNKSAHAAVRLFNTFSQHKDKSRDVPLACAPDRTFAMMVVAVMLILRHQVAAYEYGRRRGIAESPPAGFTKQAENAIRKAAERMAELGRGGSADHAAARYVEIMEALLRIWEEKRSQKGSEGNATGPGCDLQPSVTAESLGGFEDGMGSMQMDLDLSFLGSDVFSDSAFPWDGLGPSDWGNGVGQ